MGVLAVVFDEDKTMSDALVAAVAKVVASRCSSVSTADVFGNVRLSVMRADPDPGLNAGVVLPSDGPAARALASNPDWRTDTAGDPGYELFVCRYDTTDPETMRGLHEWCLGADPSSAVHHLFLKDCAEDQVRELAHAHGGVLLEMPDTPSLAPRSSAPSPPAPLPAPPPSALASSATVTGAELASAPGESVPAESVTATLVVGDGDGSAGSELAVAMADLKALVGIQPVKDNVTELADLVQVAQWRAAAGLPVAHPGHHMVFLGNAGTGKTTVARIVGRILTGLGVLPHGRVVEASRSDLVGGFLGQTAGKTTDLFNSCPRRCAVRRRGLRVERGRVKRLLRDGGDRYAAEADGGSPQRHSRDRRWLSRTHGALPRLEPRVAQPLQPHGTFPGLLARRPGPDF